MNSRIKSTLRVIAILLTGRAAPTLADPSVPKPAHLTAAEEIARQIAPEDNAYVYKDPFVHWKGMDGETKYECRADCSSFFDLLIEHAYGIKPAQLKTWTGHTRPTAAVWFDAVQSGRTGRFLTPLSRLDQARPGDVILIKYQPGAQVDTGHVTIIASTPKPRASTEPKIPDTRQWDLQVIDCSKLAHGSDDTRHHPDGTIGRGVGIGTFRIYAQPDGVIAGYSWSTEASSKFEPVSVHRVMIVRVNPRGA